ncbi:hypothetical protein ISG33_08325 [Glaciecola sp. MH2013]|uniref:hypothetical protein n=1 Tax=Glaciecola sp. MH2013 TaxID=2785524 RepID=UPI0018A01D41|nr:hypothetical protein [Glaciecola sp. MH2013]MBF7073399.1 hypothetical protein [Glaciecola sp. MH2013]
MYNFEVVMLVLFLVLTAVAYKKRSRKILLVGSLCLVAAFAAKPFFEGFNEGFETRKVEILEQRS